MELQRCPRGAERICAGRSRGRVLCVQQRPRFNLGDYNIYSQVFSSKTAAVDPARAQAGAAAKPKTRNANARHTQGHRRALGKMSRVTGGGTPTGAASSWASLTTLLAHKHEKRNKQLAETPHARK